jgi:hypothetical protein
VRANPLALKDTLTQEGKKSVYNKHRLFAFEEQTSTQKFIEELPEQVELNSPKSSVSSTKRWGHFADKEIPAPDLDMHLSSPQYH